MQRQNETPTFRDNLLAIGVGFGLIAVGCVLLFWNEGRAVQTSKSLDEGLALVISLPSSSVFEENENRLVHLTGQLKTHEPLFDDDFGVGVASVKLKRAVEMFQWVEQEHKREVREGNQVKTEVSYSYSKEWKNSIINSDSFDIRPGHHNPSSFLVKSYTKSAAEVQAGSFYLSENLIAKIDNFKALVPSNFSRISNFRIYGSMYYNSFYPSNPEVGDVRVWFEYAGLSGSDTSRLGRPDEVSIIGRQSGQKLTSYRTKSGDELEILYMGELSAKEIFHREQASNTLLTWGLRFVGWLLLFIGFTQMTNFISVLVSWLPIVRDVVELGLFLMSMSFSITVSLVTIAVGWIWYRPVLGWSLVAMAFAPYLLAWLRRTVPAASTGVKVDRSL